MPPKRTKKARARRPPTVAYTLLTPDARPRMYERLTALVTEHHNELFEARIALAWCTAWRINVDGQQQLGRCKRASDLDRELHEWDFVILLNREFWEHDQTTDIQRDALLDHELCHATTRDDPTTGEAMKDERGRTCYRVRKHDIEEFNAIAQRYGLWKRDLEVFARAMALAKNPPRLPLDDDDQPPQSAGGVH